MSKKIIYLFSLLLFHNLIYSAEINIKSGWQLLGSTETIEDISILNRHHIKGVFTYSDNKWKQYGLCSSSMNKITSIAKNRGYWVNSRDRYTPIVQKVNISLNEANSSIIKNIEQYSENNHDKYFGIVNGITELRKLYEPISAEIPNVDFNKNSIVALIHGTSSNSYKSNIIGLRRFYRYTIIDINTTINSCSTKTIKSSPATFVSLFNDEVFSKTYYKKNLIFNEILTLKNCDKDIQASEGKKMNFDVINKSEYFIGSNSSSTIRTKRFLVINSQEKLKELYEESEPPIVDFKNKTLIAFLMGTQYNGSLTIGINSIYSFDSHIEVSINSNIAQTGYSATSNVESPVVIVSIDKTTKPLIFKEQVDTKRLCH